MHLTLISDFPEPERLLRALKAAASTRRGPVANTSLWVRQKATPTASLPWANLRHLTTQLGIEMAASWCHADAVEPNTPMHIPDDATARHQSRGRRRCMSCHSLADAERLLSADPDDQVLLSPWRRPISKTVQYPLLPRPETIELIRAYPNRITVLGGLELCDLEALASEPIRGIALLGAFLRAPEQTLLQAPGPI